MKTFQKGYLELNQIYLSRQEHEAHQKRLGRIKRPHFSFHSNIELESIKQQYVLSSNRQYYINRKKEFCKWQGIQEENNHILKRLNKIHSRLPSPPSQQGTPRGRKDSLKKYYIENENKRLQNKITNMKSSINSDTFRESFRNHTKYKQNMQKFQMNDNRVKLRVDVFLDNVQQKKTNRSFTVDLNSNRIHSSRNSSMYHKFNTLHTRLSPIRI